MVKVRGKHSVNSQEKVTILLAIWKLGGVFNRKNVTFGFELETRNTKQDTSTGASTYALFYPYQAKSNRLMDITAMPPIKP